jgi:predicted Zn-ribbon and HTH transcriptional regulator
MSWSATEAAEQEYRDRHAPILADLICEDCGYRGDRELEEGVPSPCPQCDSEDARRP